MSFSSRVAGEVLSLLEGKEVGLVTNSGGEALVTIRGKRESEACTGHGGERRRS